MRQAIVIFPGTFDPMTYGHVDLIERAAKLFPQVIVAIAENKRKQPHFECEERVRMAQEILHVFPNVTVEGFGGLLSEFARSKGAQGIIRGLRTVSDFEYECQLANMNRHLAPEIETVFLSAGEQYAFVSSSLVSEIAELGGDVSAFVPPLVAARLKSLHQKKA